MIETICPNCQSKGPKTYFHKDTGSLFCQKCDKVIFPTTQKEEDTIVKTANKATAVGKFGGFGDSDDDRDHWY